MLVENYLLVKREPPRTMPSADAVRRLPPSAKLVFRALQDAGALTSTELSRQTLLAPRTVRHALRRLGQTGLVHHRSSLRDSRTSYFYLGEHCKRL